MKKIDEPAAIPLTELPPEMLPSLIQLVILLLSKLEGQEIATSSFELDKTCDVVADEGKFPVVIAGGDETSQLLTFKLLDPDEEPNLKILVPADPADVETAIKKALQ